MNMVECKSECLYLATGIAHAQQCDDGWVAHGGFCYQFVTSKAVDQPSAQAECGNQGASLLRVFSQDDLVGIVLACLI